MQGCTPGCMAGESESSQGSSQRVARLAQHNTAWDQTLGLGANSMALIHANPRAGYIWISATGAWPSRKNNPGERHINALGPPWGPSASSAAQLRLWAQLRLQTPPKSAGFLSVDPPTHPPHGSTAGQAAQSHTSRCCQRAACGAHWRLGVRDDNVPVHARFSLLGCVSCCQLLCLGPPVAAAAPRPPRWRLKVALLMPYPRWGALMPIL